jgi:hypothetical protein
MKALDENGNPILTPGGYPLMVPRNYEATKPYATCGGKIQDTGLPCNAHAGAGTNHKGVGRCWRHGGRQEVHSKKLLSLLGDSDILFPGIKQEFTRLAADRDVFDLREHIFLLESIALTVLRHAKTVEDLPMVTKMMHDAAKVVKMLDEIEHGRRLVIDVQGVHVILAQVQEVIFRHVPDSFTKDLIARDIREIDLGRTSVQNLPSPEQSSLIESVAVEG